MKNTFRHSTTEERVNDVLIAAADETKSKHKDRTRVWRTGENLMN